MTAANRTFSGLADRSGTYHIDGAEFRNCRFDDCLIMAETVHTRPVVRNAVFVNCEERSCSIWDAIIEDVTVDGLRTTDMFIVADCAFKHLVLRGKLGSVKISVGFTAIFKKRPQMQKELDHENNAYYSTVDWAIDISGGEFEDFDVAGVPLSLIRLDQETQMVLPGSLAAGGEWRQISEFSRVWGPRVNAMLKVGLGPDMLLVAPKRHREFERDLSALRSLRNSGLVPR